MIIEKVVRLPCLPIYKKESNLSWGDLFTFKFGRSKFNGFRTKTVPEEVLSYFKKDTLRTHFYFENKIYQHIHLTDFYDVCDSIDDEIQELYNNCEEHLKIIENLVGKEMTENDLKTEILSSKNNFQIRIINDKLWTIEIMKVTGKCRDGMYITPLTDICEIHFF